MVFLRVNDGDYLSKIAEYDPSVVLCLLEVLHERSYNIYGHW